MKNIFVMSASDFKYCRICLKSGIKENLSDGGTFRNVFYRVFGVKVMSKQFWLCMWCKSTLRKTHQLIRVAEESQKILEHCGQKSSELEINKHTFGSYKLSYTHNNHEDIPPLENEESYIFGEENMPEETYENNYLTEEIKTEIDEIHIENVEQVNCQAETVKEASLDPKRRKNNVNYKDFKFEIKHLSFDEQIKEIEMKKNTEKYKSMKYQCESCGVGFLTEDVFKQHMVKHEKITDHKCPTCHIYLKTKDVLSQHILAHRRRFVCQNCGATYNRWRHCVLHRYKCDNIQNNVVCDECKKIFSNSISLDVHIKGVHKKERKYMCEQCDRRFATKQRLTVHIRAHSNTRPFPCQLCPKSFTTQSNLRAHAAAHTAHKRHYCVECNLYYKSEKGLRRHFRESRRHNEEFGFVCPTCSKKFLTENVLNSHIKTRHLTTYSCEFCEKGMNLRLAFAVISSACWSAFQHGYNTGVLNAPQTVMSEWLHKEALSGTNHTMTAQEDPIVTAVWAVAVSIYCVGGMIGGVLTGVIADRFGRKGGLLMNNALVFIAAALEGSAKAANSAEMLIVGRLIIGINNGLNAGLAPMYLAEISPVSMRGSIGTVYQLVITITILLSQVLGLSSVLGTPDGWPWLLAATALPAAVQCLTLPQCPESPKYLLLNKGREVEARNALEWLRGDVAVHGEMEEMHQEAEKNKVSKKVTLRELFANRSLRQPLLIAMVVMVAQQLSGINAVIFFSTDIFKSAKLSQANAQYATLGMGAMNVVMTIISLFLVEVAGRKTLLLAGFSGMLVCTVSLCAALLYTAHLWVSYVCIALVILFVVMFAVGPGSIPWFLVTELFNQNARPAASSVAVTINWTANFIVGLSFLPLMLLLKSNTFIIFAVLQLIFILFIHFKVPETKNKTVEEITAMFRQQM